MRFSNLISIAVLAMSIPLVCFGYVAGNEVTSVESNNQFLLEQDPVIDSDKADLDLIQDSYIRVVRGNRDYRINCNEERQNRRKKRRRKVPSSCSVIGNLVVCELAGLPKAGFQDLIADSMDYQPLANLSNETFPVERALFPEKLKKRGAELQIFNSESSSWETAVGPCNPCIQTCI